MHGTRPRIAGGSGSRRGRASCQRSGRRMPHQPVPASPIVPRARLHRMQRTPSEANIPHMTRSRVCFKHVSGFHAIVSDAMLWMCGALVSNVMVSFWSQVFFFELSSKRAVMGLHSLVGYNTHKLSTLNIYVFRKQMIQATTHLNFPTRGTAQTTRQPPHRP